MTTTQRHLDEMQQRVAETTSARRSRRPRADRDEAAAHRGGRERGALREGLPRTSIRDIAAACDMSMGQLYHYISSKDDILYPDAPSQPGDVAPASGRRRLRADHRPGGQAGARAAHLDEVPLGEPGPLPVHLHREQVPGPGAPAEGPGAGRPERGGLLPAPALARSPAPACEGREAELAANLVAFICTLPGPARAGTWTCTTTAAVDAAVDFLVDFIFRGLGIERGADIEEAADVGDPESGGSGSGAHGHGRGRPSGERRHTHPAARPGPDRADRGRAEEEARP